MSILWNVHAYFAQFKETIAQKIKELRMPIEKKLKDYVKIVRWKDISYWAIKETLQKTHRTLHKHMREFQQVLNQPVQPFLTNYLTKDVPNLGIWDRPQRHLPKVYHYTMDSLSYVVKPTSVKVHHLLFAFFSFNNKKHFFRVTPINILKRHERFANKPLIKRNIRF